MEVAALQEDGEKNIQKFEMLPNTKMGVMFKKWCEWQNMPESDVEFQLDGKDLSPDESLVSLGHPLGTTLQVCCNPKDPDEGDQEVAVLRYKHDWEHDLHCAIATLDMRYVVVQACGTKDLMRVDSQGVPHPQPEEKHFPLKVLYRKQANAETAVPAAPQASAAPAPAQQMKPETEGEGQKPTPAGTLESQDKGNKALTDLALHRASTSDLQNDPNAEPNEAEEKALSDEQLVKRKRQITRLWRSIKSEGLG